MSVIEDLCGALGFPRGRFGTIAADPPWSFSDKGSRAAPDWAQAPIYQTMSSREIYDLPVDLLAAESAHLYVWTTDVHLPLALRCVEAWGFVYKKALVWVKRKSAVTPLRADLEEPGALIDPAAPQVMNGPLQIGMGHYYRTAKEICLFATRGRAPMSVHNLPDVFEAPRGAHSRKPDQIHRWAEIASPGPRVELFARRSQPGWEAWGDQFPGHSEYLRIVERANAHRREARAVTLARRAKRRVAIRWEGLIPGVTRYSGRCTHCERQICQGDSVYYHPDASGDVCAECVAEWQQGLTPASTGEEAPF